jgi:hypothetical protein
MECAPGTYFKAKDGSIQVIARTNGYVVDTNDECHNILDIEIQRYTEEEISSAKKEAERLHKVFSEFKPFDSKLMKKANKVAQAVYLATDELAAQDISWTIRNLEYVIQDLHYLIHQVHEYGKISKDFLPEHMAKKIRDKYQELGAI